MNRQQLIDQIKLKRSFLCVGLDTDIKKIPAHLRKSADPVFEFNKIIIDATKEFCVAYKPNIAFYESLGPQGWKSLKKTLDYIPENIFTIADAKRGDIGNTSAMYAKAFFSEYDFDAVTVTPYMGEDSVTPFLEFRNKWAIVLALTSNKGAYDFQLNEVTETGERVFEMVLRKSMKWGNANNMMFVVGATQADMFKKIREIVPDHFLLVPGIGAQGGSLREVCHHGLIAGCGLLVNAGRSIIYAGKGINFSRKVTAEAKKIRDEMEEILLQEGII